jgi:GntR family transcriptional regulator, transcriptional repressor for pyruvate dehydrogenase complex
VLDLRVVLEAVHGQQPLRDRTRRRLDGAVDVRLGPAGTAVIVSPVAGLNDALDLAFHGVEPLPADEVPGRKGAIRSAGLYTRSPGKGFRLRPYSAVDELVKGQLERPGTTFPRLELPRAHDYVAEQIRRQIMLRLSPLGRALPPERELARAFGVGRMTVRRALAQLEAEGLTSSRRGRNGGTFVVGPAPQGGSLDHLLQNVFERRRLIDDALAYRLEVEPAAAALAATRGTEHELARIRSTCERAARAADDLEYLEHDTELHLAVVRASGNRFFIQAVEHIRLILNDALLALPDSSMWHERSDWEHRATVAALAKQDPGRARACMRRHLLHTDQGIRALLSARP